MRALLLSAIITVACLSSVLAQSAGDINQSFKSLRLYQFDFGLGIDNDHYTSMSLEDLLAFAKDPEEMKRDLSGLEEDASAVAYGAAFYGNLSYRLLDRNTGYYRNDRELKFGFGYHSSREAMITYRSTEMDTSIVYCNLQNELTLEATYLFKGTWGKRERWNWYWGGGLSGGMTFNDEMLLISGRYFGPEEHPTEQPEDDLQIDTYAAKSVRNLRLYVPYGIGYRVGANWILGFDFRTGIGFQQIQGGSSNYIRKTGAFVLGAKYAFR